MRSGLGSLSSPVTLVFSVTREDAYTCTWLFDKNVIVQDTFPDDNLQVEIDGGGMQGAVEVTTGGPDTVVAYYEQPVLIGGDWSIPAAPQAVEGDPDPIAFPQSGTLI